VGDDNGTVLRESSDAAVDVIVQCTGVRFTRVIEDLYGGSSVILDGSVDTDVIVEGSTDEGVGSNETDVVGVVREDGTFRVAGTNTAHVQQSGCHLSSGSDYNATVGVEGDLECGAVLYVLHAGCHGDIRSSEQDATYLSTVDDLDVGEKRLTVGADDVLEISTDGTSSLGVTVGDDVRYAVVS